MPDSVTSTIGVSREVDELDVRLVEDLVVAGLERHPLRAEAMVGGDELLGERRIVDALADLLGHELAQGGVRAGVDEHIAEVAHPDAEAPLRVQLLVEGKPLLVGHLERLAPVGVVNEAAVGVPARSKKSG